MVGRYSVFGVLFILIIFSTQYSIKIYYLAQHWSQVEDTIQEDGETTETGTTCATLKYDMVCSLVPGDPGYTISGQEHRLVRLASGIPSASTRFSDV